MKTAVLAVGALALACAAQAAAQNQTVDTSWTETRFHRVHLRNGNFIDGRLVRESAAEIVLKMKVGEMAVRRDLIDRVEFVKLRHIKEKPAEVKPPPAAEPVARSTGSVPAIRPAPAETAPLQGSAASAHVSASVREKATEILERLRKAPAEQRGEIVRELAPLGSEVAVYVADVLESLDDETVQALGPMLAEMKNPDAAPLLRRAIGSGRAAVKAQAVLALGPLAQAEDAELFIPLLKQPDAALAGSALDALGALGARAALEPAVQLCNVQDPALRLRALMAVIDIARKNDLEAELPNLFRDVLERAEGLQRAELILQLSGSNVKSLAGLLVRYLRDEDSQVRAATAQALGHFGSRETGPDVLNAIQAEREKWARVALASASVRLVVREAIDPMIGWLEDEDTDVRIAAQRALRSLTGASLGLDPEEWRAWRKENPR